MLVVITIANPSERWSLLVLLLVILGYRFERFLVGGEGRPASCCLTPRSLSQAGERHGMSLRDDEGRDRPLRRCMGSHRHASRVIYKLATLGLHALMACLAPLKCRASQQASDMVCILSGYQMELGSW